MGIQFFDIRNNTLIVSNREVSAMDIRDFLQNLVGKKLFPKRNSLKGTKGDGIDI